MLNTIIIKRLKKQRWSIGILSLSLALTLSLIHSFAVIYDVTSKGFGSHKSITDVIVGPSQSKDLLFKDALLFKSSPQSMISEPKLKKGFVNHISPLIITDRYKQHPVIATDDNFFKALANRKLSIKGSSELKTNSIVIGANIAKRYGFELGDAIHLNSHAGHNHHNDDLFVTGILKQSNSVLDTALYIHVDTFAELHHIKRLNKAHFYWIDSKKPLFNYSIANAIHKQGNLSALIPTNFSKDFASSFQALKQIIGLCLLALVVLFALQALSFFMKALEQYLHEAKILRLHGYPLLFITLNFFIDQCLVLLSSLSVGVLASSGILSLFQVSIEELVLFPIQSFFLDWNIYIIAILLGLSASFLTTYISLTVNFKREKNLKI